MICLLISLILLTLSLCGVITVPTWVVQLPALLVASLSTWLFVKAEFIYLRDIVRKRKEEKQPTE